jgi:hypothetical protein
MKRIWASCVAVLIAVMVIAVKAQSLPVIPGAYGWGMQTRAAYGCGSNPTVYRVTNLNETGAGSLRAAIQATDPRVVIFEVSGYIPIVNQLRITSPCITVAGQTAPSPGVTLRVFPGGTFPEVSVETHDVLLQHLRIRPGDTTCNAALQAYPYPNDENYNIIYDHLSVSWAQDEGMNFAYSTHDSTMWRNIVAEQLHHTPGMESCSGGGESPGTGIGIGFGANISLLQNLLAHNVARNMLHSGGGPFYVTNNIVYDPNEGPTWQVGYAGYDTFVASAIGNYLKRSSNVVNPVYGFVVRNAVAPSYLYLSDNTFDNGSVSAAFTEFIAVNGIDPRTGTPQAAPPGASPMSASAAYSSALVNAGARPADRDAVDTRIVQEVINRTGSWQTNVPASGYPTLAQNTRALTTPVNPNGDDDSDGYTNLEEWLHAYAAGVEGDIPPVHQITDATGPVVVSDTMTGTAGTTLSAHTGETGATWSLFGDSMNLAILSDANRLRMGTASAYPATYKASGIPAASGYDVCADFRVFTTITGNSPALLARASGTETMYFAQTSDSNWILFVVLEAAYTPVASYGQVLANGSTYHGCLKVRPGEVGFDVDATAIMYVQDSQISATGFAGLAFYAPATASTNSTGIHLKNVTVRSVSEASPALVPKFLRLSLAPGG